jgi:hypothetical protein
MGLNIGKFFKRIFTPPSGGGVAITPLGIFAGKGGDGGAGKAAASAAASAHSAASQVAAMRQEHQAQATQGQAAPPANEEFCNWDQVDLKMFKVLTDGIMSLFKKGDLSAKNMVTNMIGGEAARLKDNNAAANIIEISKAMKNAPAPSTSSTSSLPTSSTSSLPTSSTSSLPTSSIEAKPKVS